MDTPQAELWSLDQAAKYLGIGSSTLRAMIARGDGPPMISLGPKNGLKRFRKTDLDAWLDSRASGGKKTKGQLKHIKVSK